MLFFWTSAAAKSKYVRREYEYVLEHAPERPLVPIIGDQTPLTAKLSERQRLTFFPVINELLARKRDLEARGWKPAEIQRDLCERLEEAGIHMEPPGRERIWRFFGLSGWLAWVSSPLALLGWIVRQLVDAGTQFSHVQIALAVCAAGAAAAIAIQPALYDAEQIEVQAAHLAEQLAQTKGDLSDVLSANASARGEIDQLEEKNSELYDAWRALYLYRQEVRERLQPVEELARIDLSRPAAPR